MKETVRIEKDSLTAYIEWEGGVTETSHPLPCGYDAKAWVDEALARSAGKTAVHAGYRYVANAEFF